MPDRLLILLLIVALAGLASWALNRMLARTHRIGRIELGDLSGDSQVVVFTSPYCHGCRQWLDALADDAIDAEAINVSERPDAAARYHVSSTPRIAVVDPSGTVLREFDNYAPRRSDLDAIGRLVASV